jgi:hypothetical protein
MAQEQTNIQTAIRKSLSVETNDLKIRLTIQRTKFQKASVLRLWKERYLTFLEKQRERDGSPGLKQTCSSLKADPLRSESLSDTSQHLDKQPSQSNK